MVQMGFDQGPEIVKSRRIRQTDVPPRTIKPAALETAFGNMYAYQAAIVVTVAAADTWYEVTSGLTDGGQSDGVEIKNAYQLKVAYGGKFLVIWDVSMSTSTANDELMGAVGVNGVVKTASAGQATVVSANTKSGASGSVILNLSAGDLLSLFVHNETFARDITIEHVGCSIMRIGS